MREIFPLASLLRCREKESGQTARGRDGPHLLASIKSKCGEFEPERRVEADLQHALDDLDGLARDRVPMDGINSDNDQVALRQSTQQVGSRRISGKPAVPVTRRQSRLQSSSAAEVAEASTASTERSALWKTRLLAVRTLVAQIMTSKAFCFLNPSKSISSIRRSRSGL